MADEVTPYRTPAPPPNPYAANPASIPADLTPLVPRATPPTRSGADDLDAVKNALVAGKVPGT